MTEQQKWYQGISRYQWTVLIVASLGWIFDVFEGQIFVASMREAMPDLLGEDGTQERINTLNQWAKSSFLLGGAFGGVLFGMLSDKIGRSRTLIFTILFYSIFTCVTALAQEPWHMIVLRFFVAMGVGGEWAVASAMVAEVMPKRSRAHMGSIFHGSSVLGTLLATAVGAVILGSALLENSALAPWRWGFLVGVLPAFLVLWIRWGLKEPDRWQRTREEVETGERGRVTDLFTRRHLRNTLVGLTLGAIGLTTFWDVHIYGKNALLEKSRADFLALEQVAPDAPQEIRAAALEKHSKPIKRAEMLSMAINTIGGGLGLLLFGPISQRLGRKGAFALYHILAFVVALVLFQGIIGSSLSRIWYILFLPIFGFFTLGMHAGYAIYFPELFPTRLRGSGAGVCFNLARLVAAGMVALTGLLQGATDDGGLGWDVLQTATAVAGLYLLALVVLPFARETRGTELED